VNRTDSKAYHKPTHTAGPSCLSVTPNYTHVPRPFHMPSLHTLLPQHSTATPNYTHVPRPLHSPSVHTLLPPAQYHYSKLHARTTSTPLTVSTHSATPSTVPLYQITCTYPVHSTHRQYTLCYPQHSTTTTNHMPEPRPLHSPSYTLCYPSTVPLAIPTQSTDNVPIGTAVCRSLILKQYIQLQL
jgi:hypothetical protein